MQKLDTNSTKSSPYLVLLHNWVTCITQLTHWPTTIIHTHQSWEIVWMIFIFLFWGDGAQYLLSGPMLRLHQIRSSGLNPGLLVVWVLSLWLIVMLGWGGGLLVLMEREERGECPGIELPPPQPPAQLMDTPDPSSPYPPHHPLTSA